MILVHSRNSCRPIDSSDFHTLFFSIIFKYSKMRDQLLIAVFLGIIGVGTASFLGDAVLMPHMKKCIVEFDEEGFSRIYYDESLDAINRLDLCVCLWTEAGFFKDAKVDLSTLETLLRESHDPRAGAKYFKLMKECQAESEVSDDPRTVVLHYRACLSVKRDE